MTSSCGAGRGGGYWLASRTFELSELKLLVDAVQASKVVSARTSKRTHPKLEALCSDYEGTQLQRQVYVDGRPKTDSHTLLLQHRCAAQRHQRGAEWCSSATRTTAPAPSARGSWRGENGCYYLIAYQDEKEPRASATTGWTACLPGRCWTSPPGARPSSPPVRPARLPAQALQHVRRAGAPGHPALHRRPESAMRDRVLANAAVHSRRKTVHIFTLTCPSASAPSSTAGLAALAVRWRGHRPPAVRQGLHEMAKNLAEQHQ